MGAWNQALVLRKNSKGAQPLSHLCSLEDFFGAPIMPWRSMQQEHEAAGHMASTLRRQREMAAGAQLAFSLLFGSGPQPIRW